MSVLETPFGELKSRYDALIVGSGYGGGVAASRFARMGFEVAVLEKGRSWRPGDYSNRFMQLAANTRLIGRYLRFGRANALFEFRIGDELHVLTGSGLGGGSLINAGLAFRPDAAVFGGKAWPQQVASDGHLETGFRRAARMLGVADCPQCEQLERFAALRLCADELKSVAEKVPSTISFEPRRNEANVWQPACSQCGDCWTGCNSGAKNTVANTYLTDAAHHGAELYTNIKVDFLRRSATADGADWRVFYEKHEDSSGRRVLRGTIDAGLVVLAAGVFGSTEILLRSRAKGLAVSARLGKGFSANGDELGFGHGLPVPVNGVAVGYPRRARTRPVGPNCIGMIRLGDEQGAPGDMKVQAGTMPALLSKLAPVKFLTRGKLKLGLDALINGAYKGALTRSMTFYVVGHDSARGELRLDRGELRLFWANVMAEPVYRRAEQLLGKALEKLGGYYARNPLRDKLLGGRPVTVHPLGGCGMGESVDAGVVDHRGRVFDAAAEGDPAQVHAGLYVMDGSVIPSSLAANPLLTITALAERAMILYAKDKGLELDVAPKADAPLRDALM